MSINQVREGTAKSFRANTNDQSQILTNNREYINQSTRSEIGFCYSP